MTKTEKSKFDSEAYVQQIYVARRRLFATKQSIVCWVSQLDVFAAQEFIKIEPTTDLFPRSRGERSYRLVLNIHLTPKRYGVLGISLRTDTMRIDLSKLTTGELIDALRQPLGFEGARIQASNFVHFRRFNERVAGLKSLGEEFSIFGTKGAILPRWFEALHAYGQKSMVPVERAFDDFIEMTKALDEAMFDFNAAMGAVRYRSIRCTYSVDDFDCLAHLSLR